MKAKVKTSAMGPHLRDKVFRVVGTQEVDGMLLYELDITPLNHWRKRRVYPFSASEIKILSRGT